jgi:ribosomal-protein-alanine N-acetyltransferase
VGVEIAYYLDRAYWRRGLATELVRESLCYAFTGLRLDEIGTFAKPENVTSVRVPPKAGFERIRFAP